MVVEALVQSFREVGALVDLISIDVGKDREFDYLDEIRLMIGRNDTPELLYTFYTSRWIERLAADQGYDLLAHGIGGPVHHVSKHSVIIPWTGREAFAAASTMFSSELNEKIRVA